MSDQPITLRQYRLLSGELKRMSLCGPSRTVPPITLQRLQARGFISDVRRGGRGWIWQVTPAGKAAVDQSKDETI